MVLSSSPQIDQSIHRLLDKSGPGQIARLRRKRLHSMTKVAKRATTNKQLITNEMLEIDRKTMLLELPIKHSENTGDDNSKYDHTSGERNAYS